MERKYRRCCGVDALERYLLLAQRGNCVIHTELLPDRLEPIATVATGVCFPLSRSTA